mgnify:CR=1 FL=1
MGLSVWVIADGGKMFDSLEHLDYSDPKQRQRAVQLRDMQIPFVVYNIPNINKVVNKWKDTPSLVRRFGTQQYRATESHANHLMFYRGARGGKRDGQEQWNHALRAKSLQLGHEADDNLSPSAKVASGTPEEKAARAQGYTYRHPPPAHSGTTFAAWLQTGAETRSRIHAAVLEVQAVWAAAAKAGTPRPGDIASVAPLIKDKALKPYVGAALIHLHGAAGVTAAASPSSAAPSWPWWWYPTNISDVNAAQWFPRSYLEFGDDHDHGKAPPGQDIEIFRSKDNPDKELFLFDDSDVRGLHCRFGSPGTIAEGHWDGHLNFVAILGGAKRYILMPPTECKHTAVMGAGPSSRHFGYDGSDLRTLYDPSRSSFQDYNEARAVETVLQEGEVLYIPSYFMHWIVSLTPNYQCNCRSGVGPAPIEELETIAACLTEDSARGSDWKKTVQPERWWETPASWHKAAEDAAVAQLNEQLAPALMELLTTGSTKRTPPAVDTYAEAADAADARFKDSPHMQHKFSSPVPKANHGKDADKGVQRRLRVNGG